MLIYNMQVYILSNHVSQKYWMYLFYYTCIFFQVKTFAMLHARNNLRESEAATIERSFKYPGLTRGSAHKHGVTIIYDRWNHSQAPPKIYQLYMPDTNFWHRLQIRAPFEIELHSR